MFFIAIILVVLVSLFVFMDRKRSAALAEQFWQIGFDAEQDYSDRCDLEYLRREEEELARLAFEEYRQEQLAEEEEEWDRCIRRARQRVKTPDQLAYEAEVRRELNEICREWIARGRDWGNPLPKGWV